jgi:hypothetical protein
MFLLELFNFFSKFISIMIVDKIQKQGEILDFHGNEESSHSLMDCDTM